MLKSILSIGALIVGVLALTACESIAWYGQATKGQLAIYFSSESVEKLANDENSTEQLKAQLSLSQEILEFSREELMLPVGDNFSEYVELGRAYPVWNVYAAEALSVAPYQWCYFIVGCVSYRGYFSEEAALEKAKELRQQGLDVFVHGVAAYSTLGWFDDPLLSSFIYRNEMELARLLFHELAHKLLYIEDDTLFNESFAEAVSQEGLRRWYLAKNNEQAIEDFHKINNRQQAFNQLLLKYRSQLENLFSEEALTPEEKLVKKEMIYADLNEEYLSFKDQWHYQGYDTWMSQDLNNAKLAIVGDYHQLVPAFTAKLNDFKAKNIDQFYSWVEKISKFNKSKRLEILGVDH